MAKDVDESSEKNGGARKQTGTTKRAKHRKISAASAERKRRAGMVRLSLWVPTVCADDLRRFAGRLNEGPPVEGTEGVRIEEQTFVAKAASPAQPRRMRKPRPGDDRQLDLFGPQEAGKVQ
ncbi:MAG: hypothetical protein K9G72_19105 [Rhodobacteraceae bacterium]|nr:hypothetical protein [Paracoccaceae bacterium]MCF8520189.1 hypothetical protein [Paracoccaceae bacterium]